jgi:hypothetical protein
MGIGHGVILHAWAAISARSAARHLLSSAPPQLGSLSMKNPLDSLWGTVIAGLVLTALLYFLARKAMGM